MLGATLQRWLAPIRPEADLCMGSGSSETEARLCIMAGTGLSSCSDELTKFGMLDLPLHAFTFPIRADLLRQYLHRHTRLTHSMLDTILQHPSVQSCMSSTLGIPGILSQLAAVLRFHKGLRSLRWAVHQFSRLVAVPCLFCSGGAV